MQCLVPHSGNHGYIRNLRRSPPWELELRPLGVATGNVIPTSPCWGECKPISRKRRALSQLYPAKGVAPGTADGCQWYYPLRPKARAAYPSIYLLGAGITGPRVELKVLESEKDSFKGIWSGTWLTRSWPITQGLPLALSKLTEGTVSTDLLVAYTPFFFFFFWTQHIWDKGAGPKAQGFNQLKKGHEAVRVTLPLRDF